MKIKKEMIAALAGAFVLGSTAKAEIPLTEDLSAYGYIDVAVTSSDDVSGTDAAFAEFELGFAFTPADSQWSAVAELAFLGTGTMNGREDGDVDYETVTISYAYSDELSFTVGNILSYQGFETFDATGLYQFSAQGIDGNYVYSAAYWFGASADYSTDAYSAGVWVGDNDSNEASWELFYQFTGVEGLTATVVYADDPGYETINLWASYEIDAFTFALEYTGNDWNDAPTAGAERAEDIFMALAFYSFGDAGLTFRYSTGEYENDIDFDRFTISPSYSFSDNVFGLLEYTYEDVDGQDGDTQLAAELIYSF